MMAITLTTNELKILKMFINKILLENEFHIYFHELCTKHNLDYQTIIWIKNKLKSKKVVNSVNKFNKAVTLDIIVDSINELEKLTVNYRFKLFTEEEKKSINAVIKSLTNAYKRMLKEVFGDENNT